VRHGGGTARVAEELDELQERLIADELGHAVNAGLRHAFVGHLPVAWLVPDRGARDTGLRRQHLTEKDAVPGQHIERGGCFGPPVLGVGQEPLLQRVVVEGALQDFARVARLLKGE
jgi:hypothetical protein